MLMSCEKCENCDKAETNESSLNRHKLSKHEGVRFPCEHCGAEFTAQGNLNKWVLAIAKTLKNLRKQIGKFLNSKEQRHFPGPKFATFEHSADVIASPPEPSYCMYIEALLHSSCHDFERKNFMSNVSGTNWRSMRVWGTLVTSVVLSSLPRETSEGTNFPNMNR